MKTIKSIIVGVIAAFITIAFFKILNSLLISPISEFFQGAWTGIIMCSVIDLYNRIKESK